MLNWSLRYAILFAALIGILCSPSAPAAFADCTGVGSGTVCPK